MSSIDPTKPTAGNATTASVRQNFAYAKAELEAFGLPTGAAGIGYQLNATGSVPRTQDGKNAETVSVTDFCANGVSGAAVDPTGVLDSYLGIQAAINYLTSGGIVNFPPGVFLCSGQIVIPLNVPIHLRGSGLRTEPSGTAGTKTGTEIRSMLRNGTSPAILAGTTSFDYSKFVMEGIYLSGGTNAEVLGGVGQGGAPLGNFVGLHIKKKLAWELRNVRIAGFDTDGLRLEDTFYGAAYTSVFTLNGTGANGFSAANVDGFYNCQFQYNVFGTKNIQNTFDCAWEGQWKSGARYDILSIRGSHYSPYFEANNASNTSGEADVWADTTNNPASLLLDSPYFASGAVYSAKPVPTYNFTGKCGRLHLTGSMRVFNAAPQLYPLFNMVGASALYDATGHASYFSNYAAFTATAGEVKKTTALYADAVVAGGATALQHYAYSTLRTTAAGAVNLDNIASGYFGQEIKLLFGDANVTVRHAGGGTGNLRLAASASFAGNGNDTMRLAYDPNSDCWLEISRAANG